MELVGKYVFHGDDEGFYSGEVIGSLQEGLYMIRPDDCPGHPMPDRLISVFDMWGTLFFFDTRKELDAWLLWLETPLDDKKKPKIVAINGWKTKE